MLPRRTDALASRARTPQVLAVPVVTVLVAWLVAVASHPAYLIGGGLLLVATVAVSLERIDPETTERRLYPLVAATLAALGAVALLTAPTEGFLVAGVLALVVTTGLLATSLGDERPRAGSLAAVGVVAAAAGSYFALVRGITDAGGVLVVVAACSVARSLLAVRGDETGTDPLIVGSD